MSGIGEMRALRTQLHIGGRWVDAGSGMTFESMSPATGDVLGVVCEAGPEDARAAVAAAGRAADKLAGLSTSDRAQLCHGVGGAVERRREELARLLALEQGKPYAEAFAEVGFAGELFHNAGEDVKRLETGIIPSADAHKRILMIRQPHGVVAVITPWNYPVGIPSQYLSASLAVGNAVVWKPAPTTSVVAARLLECLLEAGVPEDAFNLVFGGAAVGVEMVSNPGVQAVGFTGSAAVGAAVARQAAAKPLLLELGGNGPTIILDDADVELAVQGAAWGAFSNAGQICQSSERILVDTRVREAVVEGLAHEARAIRLGHPLEEGTTMGPLNNEGVAAKVDEHLADAVEQGAVVVVGSGCRAAGFPTRLYYEPHVLDHVSPHSLLNEDETFGPVAPVIGVDGVDEALAIANSNRFGLACSVYTSSLSRAFRVAERLQCGVVNVNASAAYWDGRTPFGGYSGKASGVGRLGGMAVIEAMTQLKSIVMHVGDGVL